MTKQIYLNSIFGKRHKWTLTPSGRDLKSQLKFKYKFETCLNVNLNLKILFKLVINFFK